MTSDSINSDDTHVRASDERQRLRRVLAASFLLAAGLILTYALMTGFGVLKTAALSIALAFSAIAAVDKRFHWLPRLLLLISVTYIALLLIDLGLWASLYRIDSRLCLRGMYVDDAGIGYRLKPNWRGTYDDGVVRDASYVINSLGHRDAEPLTGDVPRMLLLGDSFTFGSLLDQSETIDRQIERLSDGNLDAYNLGVPGYGAAAALNALATTEIRGEAAIYLFYENDLRNDGLATERNAVYNGFLIAKLDDDGQAYSVADLDRQVAATLAPTRWLTDAVLLRHALKSIKTAIDSSHGNTGSRPDVERGGPLDYTSKNVQRVVDQTLAMQSLAFERDMRFVVLVIPSMDEVAAGRHDDRVARYVTSLHSAGVSTIDPFAGISASDYYRHDGHFNPQGAKKIAMRLHAWMIDASAD